MSNNTYIINYKQEKTTLITTIFPIHFNIEQSNVFFLLLKIFEQKQYSTMYLYTYDLNKFYIYIHNLSNITEYTIKPFSYQNVMYCLEITNILYPKKKILIKDLYNFFSSDILTTNIETDYKSLLMLYEETEREYKININRKYILSTSSLSLKIYKKRFPEKYKLIPQLTETEDSFIRKSYFGGRNEIYQHIAGPNYYYDVNSLYPFIMKTCEMPVGKPVYRDMSNIPLLKKEELFKIFGFIDVVVTMEKDNENKPVLPYRLGEKDNNDMGIIYPKGVFRGTYFSEELKLAINSGYKIIKIYGIYEYENKQILFNEFVEELYNKRINAESLIFKDFYKKILNTLYGRFGLIYNKIDNVGTSSSPVVS